MRLLLIEDEERLADALSQILKKNNYGVDLAFDGETGQGLAMSGIYDVIILDWMLPCKDGVTVLKELRRDGVNTPVILLTAKDSVSDRVKGLDTGADDYLIKPFATEELLARIRALSRRPNELIPQGDIELASICFNPRKCEFSFQGNTIKLTLKESQLLELFIRHPGQIFTKEQILDNVWGMESDVELSNVEIYIHYLRKKLDTTRLQITTIRGIGYCLKEA